MIENNYSDVEVYETYGRIKNDSGEGGTIFK